MASTELPVAPPLMPFPQAKTYAAAGFAIRPVIWDGMVIQSDAPNVANVGNFSYINVVYGVGTISLLLKLNASVDNYGRITGGWGGNYSDSGRSITIGWSGGTLAGTIANGGACTISLNIPESTSGNTLNVSLAATFALSLSPGNLVWSATNDVTVDLTGNVSGLAAATFTASSNGVYSSQGALSGFAPLPTTTVNHEYAWLTWPGALWQYTPVATGVPRDVTNAEVNAAAMARLDWTTATADILNSTTGGSGSESTTPLGPYYPVATGGPTPARDWTNPNGSSGGSGTVDSISPAASLAFDATIADASCVPPGTTVTRAWNTTVTLTDPADTAANWWCAIKQGSTTLASGWFSVASAFTASINLSAAAAAGVPLVVQAWLLGSGRMATTYPSVTFPAACTGDYLEAESGDTIDLEDGAPLELET